LPSTALPFLWIWKNVKFALLESFKHVSLSVVEKKIKSTASGFPNHSHGGLTKVLGARHFGSEQAAIKVRLQARLSGAERTFFPRLR